MEALKEKALEKKKKQAEEKEQTKEKLRGFLNELNRSEYYQLAVYGTYKMESWYILILIMMEIASMNTQASNILF